MTENFTHIRKCINCWDICLPLAPAHQNRVPLTFVTFSIQKESLPSPRLGPFIFYLTIASHPILWHACHNLRRQLLLTKCRFLTVLCRPWQYCQRAQAIPPSRRCAQP